MSFCPAGRPARRYDRSAVVRTEDDIEIGTKKTASALTIRDGSRAPSITERDHKSVQAHQIRWSGSGGRAHWGSPRERSILLAGVEVRVFLVIDALLRFSGAALACSADLSPLLTKQLLDSTAVRAGRGGWPTRADVTAGCWRGFRNPPLTARITRCVIPANRSCRAVFRRPFPKGDRKPGEGNWKFVYRRSYRKRSSIRIALSAEAPGTCSFQDNAVDPMPSGERPLWGAPFGSAL